MERPQLNACAVTIEELMQAVFSVGPLRGYMTRPTVVC
jgi:hypothetical protein